MPLLNDLQKSFIATISSGMTLAEALRIHRLKWGNIAAWRRWTPGFRAAHNRALKTGIPKQRLIRFAKQVQASDSDNFILAPDLVVLLRNYTRTCVRARLRVRVAEPA
ncbi:MAG: hypothetical protein NTY53_23160 [Kiritimatiellaeota bacterium]|nr:hypothetical protein [Kiritimatiellota bacterium]